MTEDLDHSRWKGTTGGMPWMQRSLVGILSHIDQRIIYGIVALVVPFYMLFAHQGYLAQYRFFRQRFGESVLRSFWHVYLNHFHFGQIIIDRFSVYGGRKFRFEMEGYDHWCDLEQEEEGFVQLSSHTGNYELAGYSLVAKRKKMHALVFLGETETVMKNRSKMFTPNNIEMVPVMPDMSHIFTLNGALADGQIVSMPGDRIFGSQKALTCRLLGSEAKFPMGPFSLAVARDCTTLGVFVMKKDWQTYHIIINDLTQIVSESDPSALSNKKARMQALADAYAQCLERVIRSYPTQWFNYYDFWQ